MLVARLLDKVLINNISDQDCPSTIKGQILQGSKDVLAEAFGVARVGDKAQLQCACGNGNAILVQGASNVLVNALPAHRMTADRVISGCGPGKTITGANRTSMGI